MSTKKNEMLDAVHNDPLFKKVEEGMSPEDKEKVEATLNAFLDAVTIPMIEEWEKLLESPETREQLKSMLAGKGKDVVKK